MSNPTQPVISNIADITHRRMSVSPDLLAISRNKFNFSLFGDLKEHRLLTKSKRADSIKRCLSSRKVFKDDQDSEPELVKTRKSQNSRKPLPTLKSLAKENKKLQRLLKISLNQRQQTDFQTIESVHANLHFHNSDSSYDNTSLGTDFALNHSIDSKKVMKRDAPAGPSVSGSKDKSSTKKRTKPG